MKIKNIIQITASLLLTCGMVNAAEWINPVIASDGGQEIFKVESDIPPTMPCGSGQDLP